MGVPNHCGARGMTVRASKKPNNVTGTFFKTIHLLPKDLRFEHGGTELASCPGCHLISLRPWALRCGTHFDEIDQIGLKPALVEKRWLTAPPSIMTSTLGLAVVLDFFQLRVYL